MKVVKVNTAQPYEVLIARGFLGQVGKLVRTKIQPCRVCVVSDDIVAPLYGARVLDAFAAAGFEVCSYTIAHGEASKNLDTFGQLLSAFAQNSIGRTDLIVALGGGVVGDVAGFAAASYMRGIRYVQIPTTLLSAVDSSVGGKTAIDLPAGKNLAGAFHQPSMVLCDADTLQTLPDVQLKCGLAEAVKAGILRDRALFGSLAGGDYDLEAVIGRCVEIKADIVALDEHDHGQRQLLNLGHTVGHAIEQISGLQILHGQAVAIGTAIVARAAQKLGLAQAGTLEAIRAAYERLGLDTACPYTAQQLAAVAQGDKKRSGGEITLVVPRAIGDCMLYKMKTETLAGFIEIGLE